MSELIKISPEQSIPENEKTSWGELQDEFKNKDWEEQLKEAQENLRDASLGKTIGVNHEAKLWARKGFFENMQKQEKLERELNANLTSVEDLEAWAESDDPQIEKETITFNGKEITVYHLKGFSDFKFLGHVINYREGDPISVGGREISERLADNPSYWYETPNDYKEAKNWDVNRPTKANTLSTSYIDLASGANAYEHLPLASNPGQSRIVYGFSHVRPTSLIVARNQDAHTPTNVDYDNRYRQSQLSQLSQSKESINQLNFGPEAKEHEYNEVGLLRYDEKGNAIKPDYMVTDNAYILEKTDNLEEYNPDLYGNIKNTVYYINATKRHALAHNIPIVLVDRKYYS